MNVMNRSANVAFVIDDPQERARRAIGLRICRFANGRCDCAERRQICSRVEVEAAAIIDALRTVGGAS